MPVWLAEPKSKKDNRSDTDLARLVTLDVLALDSGGLPVPDLRESDFQIFDNGKRQTVVFVRQNRRKQEQPVVLGAREYSNRAGPAGPPALVILYDLMNENVLADAITRNEIIHALQRIEQSEGLYLYILTNTGSLLPIHPLIHPEAGAEVDDAHWTRQIQPLLDGALRRIWGLRPMDDRDPGIRFQATFEALSNAGAWMSLLPGRKALIWVTHGVPIEIPDTSGNLIDLSLALIGNASAHDLRGAKNVGPRCFR